MGLINTTQKDYYQGQDTVQLSGDEIYGGYQFTSLNDIISQFMVVYVGENKIIPKAKRLDVAFHAQRAMQELSFDTFKSIKSFEYTVPPSLTMPLPQDYVNYVKLSWTDSAGIEHIIYPALKTSNPSSYQQNSDGSFVFEENNHHLYGDEGNRFRSYGIEQVLANDITSSSNSHPTGSGDEKSAFLLKKYKKETRIAIANTDGHQGLEVQYGGGQDGVTTTGSGGVSWISSTRKLIINFTSTNHDIDVGMRIFGPGIPKDATVTEILTPGNVPKNHTNFPGMAIYYTTPKMEEFRLNTPSTSTALPSHSLPSSTAAREVEEEIIFVNLNRQSNTSDNYKSATPSENQDDYQDDTYWPANGERYGLDPQHSQANGSYYIDPITGLIHFGSNISGKNVVLNYISDSLGTDGEMQVHKFAEEAMYKWISHAILAGMSNIPEYQVNRFKKERFAAIRTAKLRLSNIKLEEITQILRGKSKQIKH